MLLFSFKSLGLGVESSIWFVISLCMVCVSSCLRFSALGKWCRKFQATRGTPWKPGVVSGKSSYRFTIRHRYNKGGWCQKTQGVTSNKAGLVFFLLAILRELRLRLKIQILTVGWDLQGIKMAVPSDGTKTCTNCDTWQPVKTSKRPPKVFPEFLYHLAHDSISSAEEFHSPSPLCSNRRGLGLRHVGYGIPTEMFGPCRDCSWWRGKVELGWNKMSNTTELVRSHP